MGTAFKKIRIRKHLKHSIPNGIEGTQLLDEI